MRAILLLLVFAMSMLNYSTAAAMPCAVRAGGMEQSATGMDHHPMHRHMAGQQMAAEEMAAMPHQQNAEFPAPVNDPCKIACAALCLTAGLATPFIEPSTVLRHGLRDAYFAFASNLLEGWATRPPLHPPQSVLA